tara:strand:+ start:103 stop:312 length:210 start_codon:yes stop_codon:yes gene_type:complete
MNIKNKGRVINLDLYVLSNFKIEIIKNIITTKLNPWNKKIGVSLNENAKKRKEIANEFSIMEKKRTSEY